MEEKQVAVAIFNPEEDTAKAKRAADKLVDIVKKNGWSINLGGKSDHLMYEAWQTVGKYYGYTVKTNAEFVEIKELKGFKGNAEVIDNRSGLVIGGAEAYCLRDELNWKTKTFFQLASMAQTRAGSKALRQILGFVVALAGYNPTPYEEMENGKDVMFEKPSQKQLSYITVLLGLKGVTKENLYRNYNVSSMKQLTKEQASMIIENLNKLPDKTVQSADESEQIAEDVDKEISGIDKQAG